MTGRRAGRRACLAVAAHWALSFGGFWLVLFLAAGSAERGGFEPSWLVVLDRCVRFVLMQPVAYWTLVAGGIRFWTPLGFVLAAAVFALNSAIVVALAWVALGRWRRYRPDHVR